MLNKNKRFDPFVCAKICEEVSHSSYAKAGRTVCQLIGKRLKFNDDPNKYLINRVTARNIVMTFPIPDMPYSDVKIIDTLYVMIDVKFVHSQFNEGKDFMIKATVVFEDVDKLKKIVFMGDCAHWITSFPKNFKYHKDLEIVFSIADTIIFKHYNIFVLLNILKYI